MSDTPVAQTEAGPLAGIRIIDLSAVLTGPFATHMLADHGAEVIKIEALGGDITRHIGHAPAPGMASMFQHLNRNKRAITLDLKRAEGRAVLLRLVRDADALVFNMRPEAMARLGLGYDAVRAENPAIVYCGITGFGSGGPYAGKPAYDDVIQGLTGIPDLVARASGREPRFIPMAAADRIVGLYAANALTMALLHRARTGRGTAVEVPMFEAVSHFVLVEHMFYRSFDPPLGAATNPRPLDPNCKPHRTRDGYICLLPYTAEHWHAMFDILDRPDLHDDPRFAQTSGRINEVEDLYALLDARLPERDSADWLARLAEADIPAMPMNRVEEVLTDPHLAAVDFFQRVPAPGGGHFVHMAVPFGWADWPRGAPPRPAPHPAQHSVAVLREFGLGEDEIAALIADGVVRDGAAQTEARAEQPA